jgi:hypothetical protein
MGMTRIPPAWLGAACAVIAICVIGGVFYPLHKHISSAPQAQAGGATNSSAASTAPRANTAAYELPAPSKSIKAQTIAYLHASGSNVIMLHRDSSAIDRHFSAEICKSAQNIITNGIVQEIAGIPDLVLRELILDEVHEIVNQGDCTVQQDAVNLNRIVSVTTERLNQLGIAS